jgi:hypothetical protein
MGEKDMDLIHKKPVFIAGSPRSGTTMLAGLLVLHGFWVGESGVTKDPNSNSLIATENIPIKRSMVEQLNSINYKNRGVPFPSVETVDKLDLDSVWNVVQKVLPNEQRWMFKTSGLLLFYKFWSEKFPEALWVLPRRDKQAVVDSIRRHPRMKFNSTTEAFVEAAFERQIEVYEYVDHSMFVPTKEVANLNMELIQEYFDFCQVKMDERIVRDFVKPEMMH